MAGLQRGQAVDADLATPGMATQHLMGDYTSATQGVHPPVRTPAARQDKVQAEALAQAHAMRLQTPLLGQSSETPTAAVNDSDATPAHGGVAPSPHPLAGTATPGPGAGATPMHGGAGPSSSTATPAQDALGINTPGGSTPLTSRRAERVRQQGLRDGVRLGLGALPTPHNEYALDPGVAADGTDDGDVEMTEEDAADAAARRQRAAADAKAHAISLRCAAIRRTLPRPAEAAAEAASGGGAAALLRAEVAALLQHDAKRYPAGSKKGAKKRAKKMEALAEAGPSALERELAQEELAEAAGMIQEEAEALQETYRHAHVERDTVLDLMASTAAEHMCDSLVLVATALLACLRSRRSIGAGRMLAHGRTQHHSLQRSGSLFTNANTPSASRR